MNGWQRLWMLFSIVWTGVVLFYVAKTWRMTDREELLNWNLVAEALLGLVGPILLTYFGGLLVARLVRGLRREKSS
jgi:fatty acid desaturase